MHLILSNNYLATPRSPMVLGVIKISSSDLFEVLFLFLKRFPTTGRSPNKGTLVTSSVSFCSKGKFLLIKQYLRIKQTHYKYICHSKRCFAGVVYLQKWLEKTIHQKVQNLRKFILSKWLTIKVPSYRAFHALLMLSKYQ